MKTPTNKILRHNYKDLQQKYLFLFNLLTEIREITGYKGPINDLPGVVKKLKDFAGVAQKELAKAERVGIGPTPGDQRGKHV